MEKTEKTQKRQPPVHHSAAQKAQAVLSVWTERRKVSEVCREMGVAWTILESWQNRALEGMLQALEPRVNLERGPALSPRLQALIQRRGAKIGAPATIEKLEARLVKAQENRAVGKKDESPAKESRQP